MPASIDQTVSPVAGAQAQVDVRGPRFAAWITTAVLVSVLIALAFSPLVAGVILAVQTIVFLLGAIVGPRRSPYGQIFGTFIAPRISPVTEKEPTEPLRFAQGVGFVFAATGLVALSFGSATGASIAVGFALFAAFLNAAFAICLGCLIYPFAARVIVRQTA
jgi:thiosulfate/3-mercaptopyruvate sulfurtransferase